MFNVHITLPNTDSIKQLLHVIYAASGLVDRKTALYQKLLSYSPIDSSCSSGFGKEKITVGKLLKPLPPNRHVELATFEPTAIGHWGAFVGVEAGQHTVKWWAPTLEPLICLTIMSNSPRGLWIFPTGSGRIPVFFIYQCYAPFKVECF